ncbi:MAG: endonuclease III [Verrucomicrobium sp.]|nr:endonuclease III [Verrucomicrobium sp.]
MKEAQADRLSEIILRLRAAYPGARCELDFRTPLELLVATILSAQCTDVLVNKVTPALFQKYKTAAAYAAAPLPELEEMLRRIGLYRAKAKNIKKCCQVLVEKHAGEVPREMDALVELAGVGRKTANVVLGNAFGIDEGIVVDTHVTRLSHRLDLTRQTTPEKIEAALVRRVPRPEWTLFSHLLIWHGRRRCRAQRPDCPQCELLDLCPRRGVSAKTPLQKA